MTDQLSEFKFAPGPAVKNTHRYCVPTPHGEVFFAAPEKSSTVHRLMELCEMGVLPEFVKNYRRGIRHNCHGLAFEFAFALLTTLRQVGPVTRSDVKMWRWSMAKRRVCGIDDTHSWIEHESDGEAFDGTCLSIPERPDEIMECIFVRPRRQLWKAYQVENVESRNFYDVMQWLDAVRDYPLFAKYPETSASFSAIKAKIVRTVIKVGVA